MQSLLRNTHKKCMSLKSIWCNFLTVRVKEQTQRKRTQNTGTVSLVNDTREFESNGCSTGSRVTYARVT